MHQNEKLRRLVDLPLPSGYVAGQMLKAAVIHVSSTQSFALQPSDREATLDIVADLCADLADVRPNPSVVLVGTLWCALFREDGQWYRSLIQSIDEVKKSAQVYFIDYGNSDTISLESDLRWLSDDLLNFPPQLIECQWHQAESTLNSIEKLEALIDRDEPLTITVIEAKYTAKEMNLHIGRGQPGMVTVSIKELRDEEKKFFKPTLELVPEIKSKIDSSLDNMESARSGTFAVSSDFVDGEGPKPKDFEYAGSGSMIEPAIAEAVQAGVSVDQSPMIQPNLEMETVVQPLDSTAERLPKLPEPHAHEAIPTFRPAPYVVKQILAPSQPHTDLKNVTDGNQFEAPKLPPVEEKVSKMYFPILSGEKIKMEKDLSSRVLQIPPNGSLSSFHEAIMENETPTPGHRMDHEIPIQLKVANLEARMTLLDIAFHQTKVETKKYHEFSKTLYSTVTALENTSLDSTYQQEVDKEEMKAALEKIMTDLNQTKELLKDLGDLASNDTDEVAVTQPKFTVAEDELQYLRIEVETERKKTAYLTSCLTEKARLLKQKTEEYQQIMQIVEFKDEEIKVLKSRLSPNSD